MSCSDIAEARGGGRCPAGKIETMKDWIIVAICYGFGMGVFRLLGGINAAGDALRRWGRASSAVKVSSSSSGY
jgi:hypothetical protein